MRWTMQPARLCYSILCLFCFWGCSSDNGSPPVTPPTMEPPAPMAPSSPAEHVPTPITEGSTQTESSTGEPMTTPPLWAPEAKSRVRKRLNVDQLAAAIWTATDGLRWAQDNDDDLLDTLALTLGKPDYLEVTAENLESTVLFMKFLEDAAGSVCRQMVIRDDSEGTHLLLAPPGEERAQIVMLLSKFHSRNLDTEHTDVKQWQWLYDSAFRISSDTSAAWHTVCVALIRHPDFYSY